MVTEARIRANKKYQDKAYDRLSVLLPKGTKDRILTTGATINGFISAAVLAALDEYEQGNTRASKAGSDAGPDARE